MVKTTMPGVKAGHCRISDQCRSGRGDRGAFDEAVNRMRAIYDAMCESWPIGKDAKLHLVLVIERPSDSTGEEDPK